MRHHWIVMSRHAIKMTRSFTQNGSGISSIIEFTTLNSIRFNINHLIPRFVVNEYQNDNVFCEYKI